MKTIIKPSACFSLTPKTDLRLQDKHLHGSLILFFKGILFGNITFLSVPFVKHSLLSGRIPSLKDEDEAVGVK